MQVFEHVNILKAFQKKRLKSKHQNVFWCNKAKIACLVSSCIGR